MIVCKKNQLRSILIEAAISKRHRDIQVFSAGTDVGLNDSFSQTSLLIADEFGLEFCPKKPISFFSISSDLTKYSAIFASDTNVYKRILAQSEISSDFLCEMKDIFNMNVADPVGMPLLKVSEIISYAILESFKHLYSIEGIGISLPQISVLVFNHNRKMQDVLSFAKNFAIEKKGSLLIADFIHPFRFDSEFQNTSHTLLDFNVLQNDYENSDFISISEATRFHSYSAKYEVLRPCRLPLSSFFMDLVLRLAAYRHLTLLVGPVGSGYESQVLANLVSSYATQGVFEI